MIMKSISISNSNSKSSSIAIVKVVILVGVVALFPSISCFPHNSNTFFYFALQWPGSYCSGAKNGCCYSSKEYSSAPKDFTIGGLWPETLLRESPIYCNNHSHFHVSQLKEDVRKSLERNWPSLRCPKHHSSSLWAHEWTKYGTCSSLHQNDYFEVAIKIKVKLGNFMQILKRRGVVPTNPNGPTTLYDTNTIYEAALQAYGYPLASIVCNNDKFGHPQLYKVVFCADLDSRVIDCLGAPIGGQCNSSKIKFPSFSF